MADMQNSLSFVTYTSIFLKGYPLEAKTRWYLIVSIPDLCSLTYFYLHPAASHTHLNAQKKIDYF